MISKKQRGFARGENGRGRFDPEETEKRVREVLSQSGGTEEQLEQLVARLDFLVVVAK